MQKAFMLAVVLSLSGCAGVNIPGPSVPETFVPMIDPKATPSSLMASYEGNRAECREMAEAGFRASITPEAKFARGFGPNVGWKERYTKTYRNCLIGRGYAVVN